MDCRFVSVFKILGMTGGGAGGGGVLQQKYAPTAMDTISNTPPTVTPTIKPTELDLFLSQASAVELQVYPDWHAHSETDTDCPVAPLILQLIWQEKLLK